MPFDGRGKAAGEPTDRRAATQIRGTTPRSVVHTTSAGPRSWCIGRAIVWGSNALQDVRRLLTNQGARNQPRRLLGRSWGLSPTKIPRQVGGSCRARGAHAKPRCKSRSAARGDPDSFNRDSRGGSYFTVRGEIL